MGGDIPGLGCHEGLVGLPARSRHCDCVSGGQGGTSGPGYMRIWFRLCARSLKRIKTS